MALVFPANANAQEAAKSTERAAAQVLFDAGRQAMANKDYDEACAKFEESHRLDPAAGTLLNLGNCEEKRGRPASAWERYKGAIGQLREGDRRRLFAEEKIATLMPDVPHLTVHLADDAPEGTQVWRNETPISGSLGIPLPLNPGVYEVVVEAPSFQAQIVKVELRLGEQKTITVRPGDKILVETKTELPEQPPPPVIIREEGLSKSDWGYIVGGVGAASGATAAGLTLAALGPKRRVNKYCSKGPFPDAALCNSAKDDGKALTDPATVLTVLGVVAGGVGLYLIITDDSDESLDTQVQAGAFGDFTGLRVTRSF